MAQILWKGGKEPQDQDNCFGKFEKSRSLATYADAAEDADVTVEVAGDEQTESENRSGISSGTLGEIIAKASERLAQEQIMRRPVEEPTRQADNGERPNKQQRGQGVAPTSAKTNSTRTATPKARVIEVNSSDEELYFLAQKRMEARAEGPLVIESNLEQRRLVMMSRAVRGSVVVEIEADTLPQSEAKPVPTAVLRFPLSEKQQRADQFYQATGIKFEDFVEEVLRPGWTVAEMISPRENARRVKSFFYDRVYDMELAKLKAAKAVGEFLHKKRSYRTGAQQAQLD